MNDYEATPQFMPVTYHLVAVICSGVLYLGIALGFCWVLS